MAQISDDVFFGSISEISARLLAKEFSCVELTRAFCDRLERNGPRYNALALSLRERAIRKARTVDDDLKRGRHRSPLHGIPYGAKDLFSVSGHITTWGAKPYAAQVFDYDATVVRKLENSGALLTGKLSMVELAGGGGYDFAAASLQGPGINPWDRSRWAGGSSSGPGSAVAAGLVPFALGSETWGSILTPSAFCGITALRPTYGLVSRYGAMALAWTLDKVGPMCRSAEDCGVVLQAIAGGDSKDPGSAGKGFYFTTQYSRKPSEMRIGYAPADIEEWVEPSTRDAFRTALAAIRETGAQLKEVRLPDLPYSLTINTIIGAEAASIFEPLIASGQVDQLADKAQIAGLKSKLEIRATDYLKAMRLRRQMQVEMNNMFVDLDLLISPSRFALPTKLSEPLSNTFSPNPAPANRGLRDLSAFGNLCGLPALSLPCGFANGLPVAFQIVGRPFSENLALAVGMQYQKMTDWHRRRPPL
jgi:aspartyl-tRNA(Asn)/glutamyl-tRNA(Gln) amidotransferase subunit A